MYWKWLRVVYFNVWNIKKQRGYLQDADKLFQIREERKKNRCDVTTTRVEKEQHGKIERAALQRFLTLAHSRYEGLPLELMKEME